MSETQAVSQLDVEVAKLRLRVDEMLGRESAEATVATAKARPVPSPAPSADVVREVVARELRVSRLKVEAAKLRLEVDHRLGVESDDAIKVIASVRPVFSRSSKAS